jgi:hypothetical protein
MKLIALAAALALGGTAFAQTAPTPAEQTEPATAEQPVTTVTQTTDTAGNPVTVTNVASPGNYTAPPPPDPASSYPPCSRTVRDHCRQRGGF